MYVVLCDIGIEGGIDKEYTDPLGQFAQFNIFDAAGVEWVLKNIFNVSDGAVVKANRLRKMPFLRFPSVRKLLPKHCRFHSAHR